jgi:hypothetical protein
MLHEKRMILRPQRISKWKLKYFHHAKNIPNLPKKKSSKRNPKILQDII